MTLALRVRLSTALLLTLIPACGSGSSSGPSSAGGGTGSGGTSGPGGGTGGTSPGSGGASTGLGGTSAASGGAAAGSGGTSTATGGTSAASGGTSTATGGGDTGVGGGSSASGGTTGRGGGGGGRGGARGGSGGTPQDTGGTGSGGGSSLTGGSSSVSPTFTVNVELSSAIGTVGIATWSLGATVDSAKIEFGRDQSKFELEAPVDLAADQHRTLLLGMKQDSTYYVRVTASGGGQTYVSQVASIKTGLLPNGLPSPEITDTNASALYAGGGFNTVCTGYTMMGFPGGDDTGGTGVVFTFDRDGDLVWAYDLAGTVGATCTRARMSIDGKYMWVGNFGNTTTDGALMRISMDGLGTPYVYEHPGRSHDFAVLPDEHIVFFARDDGGSGMTPESIYELDPETSQAKLLYSELTDFGDVFDTRGGHTNQVNYVPELKAVSFSMYFINTIALISYPEGKLLAAFGGDKSTFPGMSWNGQHGHEVHSDHIDIFNNNGTNGGASVLRFKYDLQAKTATKELEYAPGLSSQAFGDVKELPNGNYFVTYSTAGVLHEIDASMKLLREVDTGESIGYAEHRATLYGKPPPYAE
jgi:hypothetical protein